VGRAMAQHQLRRGTATAFQTHRSRFIAADGLGPLVLRPGGPPRQMFK